MEKKTIQRIIGILVIIAIILILLPLFLNKENMVSETGAIKAPPFPDQETQPAAVPAPAPAVLPQTTVTDDSALTMTNAPAPVEETAANSIAPVSNTAVDASSVSTHAAHNTDAAMAANNLAPANPPIETIKVAQNTVENKQPTAVVQNTVDNKQPAATVEAIEAPVVVSAEDDNTVIKINHPIESSQHAEEHPSENVTIVNPKKDNTVDAASTPVVTVEREVAEPNVDVAAAPVPVLENKTLESKTIKSKSIENKKIENKSVASKAVTSNHAENKFIPVIKPAKPYKPASSQVADKSTTDKSKWAVQLGSFNNKSNALKLTEKMRAAGFTVFTREKGQSTRVYIGPELKQASAIKVSNKIEHDMNIHGIIVSYNKLEG